MQCFNNFIQSMLHNFKFSSQYSLQNTPCMQHLRSLRRSAWHTEHRARMQRERRQSSKTCKCPTRWTSPPSRALGHKLKLKKNRWHLQNHAIIQGAKVTVHKTTCFWKWLSSTTNQDGGIGEVRIFPVISLEPLTTKRESKYKILRVLVNDLFFNASI